MTNREIQQVVRQAKRYTVASAQDADPFIGHLHATYAVGWLDMLLGMVPREKITEVTGERWDDLRADATVLQDTHQKRIRNHLKVNTPPWAQENSLYG